MANKTLTQAVIGIAASISIVSSVMADTVTDAVKLNIDPDEAQTVSTNNTNPQIVNLNKQADAQEQKAAISQGQTFVSQAPDPNVSNYWAQKSNENTVAVPAVTVKPIDKERLQRESQGLKTIMSEWNKQKPAFNQVMFESDSNNETNDHLSTNAAHAVKALPGTMWYATMASGADSYVPGVVRVQLQEGPFDGGYALGKFQIAPDGEHLILTFSTLTYNNQSFPISAIAMDPNTQVSGMTGDIDHHFFTRFVIPGAVGFLQGAVNLLKANQTVVMNGTTSTVSGPELSNAQLALLMGSSAADRLQDATTLQGILRLPEVKIAPGAGLGFLLLKSI